MYNLADNKICNKESLNSYILRLCKQKVISPVDLMKELEVSDKLISPAIKNIDFDWPYNLKMENLTSSFGIDKESLLEHTILYYNNKLPGLIFDENIQYNPSERSHAFWFDHPYTKICPKCLEENEFYYLDWKIRPKTICEKHKLTLINQCECGERFNIRNNFNVKQLLYNPFENRGISENLKCPRCGIDIRKIKSSKVPEKLIENLLKTNEMLDLQNHNSKSRKTFLEKFVDLSYVVAYVINNTNLYNDILKKYIMNDNFRFVQNRAEYNNPIIVSLVSYLTVETINKWPFEFEKQIYALKERGLYIPHPLEQFLSEEVKEIYIKTTTKINYAFNHYVKKNKSSGYKPLSDYEWFRIFLFLTEINGEVRLTLDLIELKDSNLKVVFMPSLRRSVEGVFYRVCLGKPFSHIPESICTPAEIYRLTKSLKRLEILDSFIKLLDQIHEGRYKVKNPNLILLKNEKDATDGISDLGWLEIRDLVPFGKLRSNNEIEGQSISPRELVNNIIRKLSFKNGIRKKYTYSANQIGVWCKNDYKGFELFIKQLLKLVEKDAANETNIEGELINQEIWDIICLKNKDVQNLINKHNLSQTKLKNILEVLLRSVFYKEQLISTQYFKEYEVGMNVNNTRIKIKTLLDEPLLDQVMKRIIEKSDELRKNIISKTLIDARELIIYNNKNVK